MRRLRIDFKHQDIAKTLLDLGIKENVLDKREIESRLNLLRSEIPK